ncbi:M48 family metallopeptidase [Serpentinicella alkaliphila]|nr:M48 family metallopeptidase [Serpentinicella alkaliphila]
MANIRINGVRISSHQFPAVYEKTKELCELMEIKKIPDIFVIQSGGVLNAFATRFFGKNMVVLYSEIFDLIDSSDENVLSFILTHELAHIKRNHITKQALILPAMWVPFLGKAYSRACEYTCDRMAAHYINDPEAAMEGLTMLAIGKTLFKQVNREEYLHQSSNEKGLFTFFAEKLSTHPTLPKRINKIELFFNGSSKTVFKTTPKVVISIVLLSILMSTLGGVGFYYADEIKESINTFFPNFYSNDDFIILIEAVVAGDTDEVKSILESRINPDIVDSEGWTPLMWATQLNDLDMINLFIEYGADPNKIDYYYEETALIIALTNDYVEAIAALLEAGADPNLSDSYGWTPLMSAVSNDNSKNIRILLEAGADPNVSNIYGYTPLMSASSKGNLEAARELLEFGAITDIRDDDKFTAFLYAKKSKHNDIADLIKMYEKN